MCSSQSLTAWPRRSALSSMQRWKRVRHSSCAASSKMPTRSPGASSRGREGVPVETRRTRGGTDRRAMARACRRSRCVRARISRDDRASRDEPRSWFTISDAEAPRIEARADAEVALSPLLRDRRRERGDPDLARLGRPSRARAEALIQHRGGDADQGFAGDEPGRHEHHEVGGAAPAAGRDPGQRRAEEDGERERGGDEQPQPEAGSRRQGGASGLLAAVRRSRWRIMGGMSSRRSSRPGTSRRSTNRAARSCSRAVGKTGTRFIAFASRAAGSQDVGDEETACSVRNARSR
jgi:hypothetical protein